MIYRKMKPLKQFFSWTRAWVEIAECITRILTLGFISPGWSFILIKKQLRWEMRRRENKDNRTTK